MSKKKMSISRVLFCTLFALLLTLNIQNVKAATITDCNNQEEQTTLSAHVITTATDADYSKSSEFIVTTTTENEVVPLEVSCKGYVDYCVFSATSVGVQPYKDEDCTKKSGAFVYVSSSSEATESGIYYEYGNVYCPKKGTYYLQIDQPGDYVFSFYEYSGENKTLKENTYTTSYSYSYDTYNYNSKTIYYKYKATKTGYITLNTNFESSYGNLYLTLCNSKKKALTTEVYVSNSSNRNEAVFAVKKGATYYIKATSSSGVYQIKSKISGVSEKSGTKEKNAILLKSGKYVNGTVLCEDKTNKVDYYKFKLNKSGKVTLSIKGNVSSGAIKVEIYSHNLKGTVTDTIREVDYSTSYPLTTYTSKKLPAGTYYVKVTKSDSKSCGNYSIKYTVK